jgi:hypothetical protein
LLLQNNVFDTKTSFDVASVRTESYSNDPKLRRRPNLKQNWVVHA